MDKIYAIRKSLEETVARVINKELSTYINSQEKSLESYLLYPLTFVEMGLFIDKPESLAAAQRRECFAFWIEKSTAGRKELPYSNRGNIDDYNKFRAECWPRLDILYDDYKTFLELQDASSCEKSLIKEMGPNQYQFITALVCEKYREEDFYFYSADNPSKISDNQKYMDERFLYFVKKLRRGGSNKVKRLHIDIDSDILDFSISMVSKDIDELSGKLKSPIISSRKAITNVLGFLYYLATTKKMQYSLYRTEAQIKMNCLLDVDKSWLIQKICKVMHEDSEQVARIIDYLTNDGTENTFEFPLFEHQGHIITAPSFLILNDWQFSLVNGHYFKNILFERREKTISKSTQGKLIELLQSVENIVFCEEYSYHFKTAEKVESSDIDFAMYDMQSNVMMVIEAKWKDNHYAPGNRKRYIKIEDTFRKIFSLQIDKHKRYFSTLDNPLRIFKQYSQSQLSDLPKPEMFYVAIDKRNQLHIDGNHMITEFMLLAFMLSAKENDVVRLDRVIAEIAGLETKVKYISIPPQKEIHLPEGATISVDTTDFKLTYP